MSAFLRQAEEILEVAAGGAGAREVAILLGAPGGIRMMDPAGSEPAGLAADMALLRFTGWSGAGGRSGSKASRVRAMPVAAGTADVASRPGPPFANNYAARPAAISGLR